MLTNEVKKVLVITKQFFPGKLSPDDEASEQVGRFDRVNPARPKPDQGRRVAQDQPKGR
jgi:hypothetical protein